MNRFGTLTRVLLSCALIAPVGAQAAKHGPDITLQQLENIQTVSLQKEEYAPFTLRAEAPAQFKLVGLPSKIETLQDKRVVPNKQICASIRNHADDHDPELSKVLSLALDFEFCAEQAS